MQHINLTEPDACRRVVFPRSACPLRKLHWSQIRRAWGRRSEAGVSSPRGPRMNWGAISRAARDAAYNNSAAVAEQPPR